MRLKKLFVASLLPFALSACVLEETDTQNEAEVAQEPETNTQPEQKTNNDTTKTQPAAKTELEAGKHLVAIGATADRSSASITLYNTTNKLNQSSLNASSNTDVALNVFEDNIYAIERFGANSITKYKFSNPTTAIWQCSTEGSDSNSNPYQLLQVSENKAYLLRYGTGKIWVVNPAIADSSKCATDFKTAEIDLAQFDTDGVPNMSSAVIVDGKLYVAMQRLAGYAPTQNSQLAVIDTSTNTLVDVDSQTAGVQAIDLGIKNVGTITYSITAEKIYAQGVGKYASLSTSAPAEYTGGIASVSPTDYSVALVLDDTSTTKQISGMEIINSTLGYFISYAGWKNNTLHQFNPQDGSILSETNGDYTAVAGLNGINISAIKKGPNDTLWLATDSGFKVINTKDNTIAESLIDTKMNPSDFDFISQD